MSVAFDRKMPSVLHADEALILLKAILGMVTVADNTVGDVENDVVSSMLHGEQAGSA